MGQGSRRLDRLTRVSAAPFPEAGRPLPMLGGFLADVMRSRQGLLMENALLRQQLIVASRKVKRPIFKAHERGFVVLLASLLPQWRNALLLVKPDTVPRWHRQGFRLFWRWRSRSYKSPISRVDPEVIALIHRMASENILWGAERILGELLKLGIRVAKRTIQRHMTKARPCGYRKPDPQKKSMLLPSRTDGEARRLREAR